MRHPTLRPTTLGVIVCLAIVIPIHTHGTPVDGSRNTGRPPTLQTAPEQSPGIRTMDAQLSGTGVPILYAPSEADDSALRADIATITGATADYFDARGGTPTLDELQQYGCVFTWANASYSDMTAMGDLLADYVDAGGVVVLGAFVTYTNGNHLAGRIMTPGYSPVTAPAGDNFFTTLAYNGDGTTLIWDEVASYSTDFPDNVILQGDGVADGTLGGQGLLAAAFRPDYRVVFVNGAGDSSISSAETAQLIANACSIGAATSVPIPTVSRTGTILLTVLMGLVAVLLVRRFS